MDNNYDLLSSQASQQNIFKNIDYKSLQLTYLFYVIVFWTSFLFILKNTNQFKQIINFILLFPIYRLIDFIYERKQKKILEYFQFLNIIQNLKVYQVIIKKFLNLLNYLLSTTKKEMDSSHPLSKQVSVYGNLNIFITIKSFITDFIYLFRNIRRSIKLIQSTLSINILWILTLPYRITVTIRSLSYEIRNFFKTIEQIIQILRLPIEILILIGKFFSSVGNFLRRIKRPNI